MAIIEIKVPDIGDFDQVTVIELLVKPGDSVRAQQSLLTVESDKASMEIPSSHAGVVAELKVSLGDKVSEGSLLLLLEAAADAAAPQPAAVVVPPEKEQIEAQAHAESATPAIPSAAASDVSLEVRVPDIGDFKDVRVIEIMVKPGDSVRLEQSLVTVESDKASMEIPSSAAGVVQQIKVKVGDLVNIGDLLLLLTGVAQSGQSVTAVALPALEGKMLAALASTAQQASDVIAHQAAAAPAHQPMTLILGLPHASPSVRKFARELGVLLPEVTGTGPKGRITEEDVRAFTRAVMGGVVQTVAIAAQQAAKPPTPALSDVSSLGLIPWPKVDFAKFGAIERKELPRIKKISGANLLRNAIMIPAVTNHDDADITNLESFRISVNKEFEKAGVKVTMLAFLIKAVVAALKKFPEFNSSLDGDALIYKQYYHIGFAADTPNGLMVPVIKDADQKGIVQICEAMSELSRKAREGKLTPAEMNGASFTISSLGGIGGRYFTPIINAPEVAILGVCKSSMQPVWDGTAFQPRLMLPLSLTWDHRVIDGAAAARFNAYMAQILGDFRRVLL